MKNLFLLLFGLLIGVNTLNAQGDECFSALDLGALPTPEPCGFSATPGIGLPITQNGTTTGYTPGNPYVNRFKRCVVFFRIYGNSS